MVCLPFCDAENRLILVKGIDPLAAACETTAPFTTGGDAEWFAQTTESYYGNDAAQSGAIGASQEAWMEATVEGPGQIRFQQKMSSATGDTFIFYIDDSPQAFYTSGSSWTTRGWWQVGSGTHTLKWKYIKDSSGSSTGDCWVDYIEWTGDVPESGGDWALIEYTYDPSGRRIAKDVDGVVTKYLYDGDHCIAEYDDSDNLLRTYIYGPGVDQPICMTETTGSYADTYYYHFDALGSVVALSDADGDTVEVYEYDVYGQVAASDPNHPNPFLFTGRRYDTETGLYYCRARYYNPTLGRFLQTDPIGYGDGMHLYRYCRNNPVSAIDPSGMGSLVVPTGRIAVIEGKRGTSPDAIGNPFSLLPGGLLGDATDALGEDVVKRALRNAAIRAKMVGAVLGAVAAYNSNFTMMKYWRAFIEVKDYNDINGNELRDEEEDAAEGRCGVDDLWGEGGPYWVELRGVKPLGWSDYGYWPGAGYDSSRAAYLACQRALVLLGDGAPMDVFEGYYWNGVEGKPALVRVTSLWQNILNSATDLTQAAGEAITGVLRGYTHDD